MRAEIYPPKSAELTLWIGGRIGSEVVVEVRLLDGDEQVFVKSKLFDSVSPITL